MTNEMQSGVYPVPEETVLEACHDRPLPKMGNHSPEVGDGPDTRRRGRGRRGRRGRRPRARGGAEGGSVAVGAGSRGINNLPKIVRGVVGELQERGWSRSSSRPWGVTAGDGRGPG